MARTRDYKAEYARSKARAQALGYRSEREVKYVRKAFKVPRGERLRSREELAAERPRLMQRAGKIASENRRMRKESRAWSEAHSHKLVSRYSSRMSDDQVERYYSAYVKSIDEQKRENERRKLREIKRYLVPDYMDVDEWEQEYGAREAAANG